MYHEICEIGMDIPFPGSEVLCICATFVYAPRSMPLVSQLPVNVTRSYHSTHVNCIAHCGRSFFNMLLLMPFAWYLLARFSKVDDNIPSQILYSTALARRECNCTVYKLTL